MKTKTYNVLTHIPIVGTIVKYGICDPSFLCSPMLSNGLPQEVLDFKKHHPDIQITRKLFKQIMNK